MVFEKEVKKIKFESCQNGQKTMMKKVTIPRIVADEINKIIAVCNSYNPELKLDNSLLYEICLFDLIGELEENEESAIAILTDKVISAIQFKREMINND